LALFLQSLEYEGLNDEKIIKEKLDIIRSCGIIIVEREEDLTMTVKREERIETTYECPVCLRRETAKGIILNNFCSRCHARDGVVVRMYIVAGRTFLSYKNTGGNEK